MTILTVLSWLVGALIAIHVIQRLAVRCDHELVDGRDDKRGRHRHCLKCGYRSPGFTGWTRRDRFWAWVRTWKAW